MHIIREMREVAQIAVELTIILSLGVGAAVFVFFVWYSN